MDNITKHLIYGALLCVFNFILAMVFIFNKSIWTGTLFACSALSWCGRVVYDIFEGDWK